MLVVLCVADSAHLAIVWYDVGRLDGNGGRTVCSPCESLRLRLCVCVCVLVRVLLDYFLAVPGWTPCAVQGGRAAGGSFCRPTCVVCGTLRWVSDDGVKWSAFQLAVVVTVVCRLVH